MAAGFLDYYFQLLRRALSDKHPEFDGAALEAEWRSLYDIACADFQRFLQGWSPGHWKVNGYSVRLTERVLNRMLDRIL